MWYKVQLVLTALLAVKGSPRSSLRKKNNPCKISLKLVEYSNLKKITATQIGLLKDFEC